VQVTGRKLQGIDGWGVSVVAGAAADPITQTGGLSKRELRRLDRLVFRAGGVNLVRVFGPGTGPQRGNAGPPRLADPRFGFMRRVRRYGVRFMLTGGDAPKRLKEGDKLAPGAEAEYARYLASVLRFARTRLKVPFTYSAVGNEIDFGDSLLQMSPEQAARVYQELAGQIRARRLGTKLVVGDDINWGVTERYARAVLAAPGVRGLAARIASHDYDAGNVQDRRDLAALAAQHGLGVWQTEFGTGCGSCPDDRTMASGLQWSRKIYLALTEANARAWFAFRPVSNSEHGPEDALLVRQYGNRSRPFYAGKRFYVFRQYSSAAPPRSRRLDTAVSGEGITAVAFTRKGVVAVVINNPGSQAVTVDLDFGGRKGRLSGRRTSPGESFRSLGRLAYGGSAVQVALPRQSVTTYELRPGSN